MIQQLLSTLTTLAARPPTTTECSVEFERIVCGLRIVCSEGTSIELTAAEVLKAAELCGLTEKP